MFHITSILTICVIVLAPQVRSSAMKWYIVGETPSRREPLGTQPCGFASTLSEYPAVFYEGPTLRRMCVLSNNSSIELSPPRTSYELHLADLQSRGHAIPSESETALLDPYSIRKSMDQRFHYDEVEQHPPLRHKTRNCLDDF